MKCLSKTLAVSLFAAMSITVSADNLLTDTKFSSESGWLTWVEKPALDAGGFLKLEDGKALAKSPAVNKQVRWNLQLFKDIAVDADKSYKVTFKANSDKAGKITIGYILSKAPYADYGTATIDVEPGEKIYECTLAVKKDKDGKYDLPRSLRFWLGELKDANITVSDVSLEEIK